jgi:hypothetical protein
MPDELDDDDPLGGPPFVAPFPTAEELAHMVVFRCTGCTEVVANGDDPANYDAWLGQQIEVYGWTKGLTGCSAAIARRHGSRANRRRPETAGRTNPAIPV